MIGLIILLAVLGFAGVAVSLVSDNPRRWVLSALSGTAIIGVFVLAIIG